jgi:hypothetical protein
MRQTAEVHFTTWTDCIIAWRLGVERALGVVISACITNNCKPLEYHDHRGITGSGGESTNRCMMRVGFE